mmetsp:Transcript_57189/g.107542  ORF Transcript_57189/g.107542 Transcript_57189/m.107542 type:complete len:129 (+) Transcript_57189:2-388(+)
MAMIFISSHVSTPVECRFIEPGSPAALYDENGYDCDIGMEECASNCEKPVPMAEPDLGDCDTWRCVAGCAKEWKDLGCQPLWRELCLDLVGNRKMAPCPISICDGSAQLHGQHGGLVAVILAVILALW